MDFGKLISAVEAHKCLYDKEDPNYKNLVLKENAWKEISEITAMSKEDCKKRWNLLREKYNKEMRKRDIPSGSATPVEEEWPFLASLMFLKGFIQPRKTKSNHFVMEITEDIENDIENNITEPPTQKRAKGDAFADTCNSFKEVLDNFKNRQKDVDEDNLDDVFLSTILLLYKDLPESVKDSAGVEMITYVTTLRSQHIFKE